jgi:hypothetical protein
MANSISRRDFLKFGLISLGSLGGLASNPFPLTLDDQKYPTGEVGRITVSNKVTVYNEPNWDSTVVGYINRKDQLIQIYYEIISPEGPDYNPLWYRVWGGYIHSAYVQKVKFRFNANLQSIPKAGQLCEVTIPFTNVYKLNTFRGWERFFRLYYETTHWVTDIQEGPDGKAWYEIDDVGTKYLVPAEHLRPVSDEEMSPISPDLPWEAKRIEVSIAGQTLTAFENDEVALQTRVSTGVNIQPDPNDIPWNTPRGRFNIYTKMPSTHMGEGRLTGDPEAYELPGVPWTIYFIPETGVAFHGAYWHNNFGLQMSHGCVNMRPSDAQWLFRWCHPVFELPIKDRSGWEKRGHGTQVDVV